ncbi:MAG: hypothetical protein ACOYO1_17940 [Bacteroidales bacterium]
MCHQINCCIDCKDWLILLIGFGLSIGWALFIYSLRPKLEIGIPEKIIENGRTIIVVPVENISKKTKASKISLEIAVIYGKYTYHFKTDINDYAFIPEKKNGHNSIRKFKAYDINDYLQSVRQFNYEEIIKVLNDPEAKLRVRIHATHSFSGLGRTFERCFEITNDKFIDKKC